MVPPGRDSKYRCTKKLGLAQKEVRLKWTPLLVASQRTNATEDAVGYYRFPHGAILTNKFGIDCKALPKPIISWNYFMVAIAICGDFK